MSPPTLEQLPSPPASIYETVLYATDVAAVAAFYRDVIGLRLVEGPTEIHAALRVSDGAVLLIFNPALTSRVGRPVPSQGASGPGHIAFSVNHGALIAWRERLVQHGYVRDPTGNSVELVEGNVWPR